MMKHSMFNIHSITFKVVAVLATQLRTREQSHQIEQEMFITYLYFFDFCPLDIIVSTDFVEIISTAVYSVK